jgi:hypothetical protein
MIVNGKKINKQNFADYTKISARAVARFHHIDKIMFAMSPFLTTEETYKIMDAMEKMAEGKLETNWSASDAIMFCRETIGNDRWNALEMIWEINSQNALQSLYKPEELRDAWVHKISMCEGTAEEVAANPDSYILIKTTKNMNQLNG